MAYSEELATRVRAAIGDRSGLSEQKMFGGVVWLLDGNMACGTMGDDLLVRLDRDDVDRALTEPGVAPMTMQGRTMRSFVIVDADAIEDDADLIRWAEEGLAFAASLPAK